MEFEIGYILALVVIGLSFLGFFLALIIDEINKKKGILIFLLSLIIFVLGVYSYYVVGLWQRQELKGAYSPNKLNKYLNIYKPQESQKDLPLSEIPF